MLTRRFNRSLAVAARERMPAEILLEYLEAMLAGHGQAAIVKDARTESGWKVTWPEHGELASTQEQRQWAWTQYRQAGWGMPAQHVQLEADIRSQMSTLNATVNLGSLPPSALFQMREIVRGALASSSQSSSTPIVDQGDRDRDQHDAIDAEFTEHESASASDSEPGMSKSDSEETERDE